MGMAGFTWKMAVKAMHNTKQTRLLAFGWSGSINGTVEGAEPDVTITQDGKRLGMNGVMVVLLGRVSWTGGDMKGENRQTLPWVPATGPSRVYESDAKEILDRRSVGSISSAV